MDREKFKSLVHYVCWSSRNDPAQLGAVKLNKALWLSDFQAFLHFGKAITGARYVKRKFGPVPKPILPVLRELEEEGALSVRETSYFGRTKKEFIVHRDASNIFLTPEEDKLVAQVIEYVCELNTAASISNESHDHVWKAAADGEEIPYFTVFSRQGTLTAEDYRWAYAQLSSAQQLAVAE